MTEPIKMLLVIVLFSMAGCATRGPVVLSQCLSDDAIMSAYQDFQSENHKNFIGEGRAYLTGGYNAETGIVSCYWQTHSLSADIFSPNSNPISVCNAAGNRHCAILMDGPNEVFQPTSRQVSAPNTSGTQQPPSTASSSGSNVVYYLLGAFAEGIARGLAESYANRPARTNYESSQSERPLRCSADPMPGPFGQGYTCRR